MNKEKILEKYYKQTLVEEDAQVLDFLQSLPKETIKYLEVGAGLGRFPLLLKNSPEFKHLDIVGLEINEVWVKKLEEQGLPIISGSVLSIPFPDNTFTVIHASHLIEHFGYPDVVRVLDELFRVVKEDGYVIFRSPLSHPGFYNDIDHIRPYPPKTILQYFENKQQQKKGVAKVRIIKNWNRREAKNINSSLPGTGKINLIFKILWSRFGIPKDPPNGYVAVFQKQKS